MFSIVSITLSRMINFRLFLTVRVCKRQFQILWKWLKVFQTARKQCGKRRNCTLRAISPFSPVFSRLVQQTHKNQGLFGKGLWHITSRKPYFTCKMLQLFTTLSQISMTSRKKASENIFITGEHAGNKHISIPYVSYTSEKNHILRQTGVIVSKCLEFRLV